MVPTFFSLEELNEIVKDKHTNGELSLNAFHHRFFSGAKQIEQWKCIIPEMNDVTTI